MKKNLFTILMMIGIFFGASCSNNDAVVDPTLELSEHTIKLAKNASETTILVTSNQAEWVPRVNAEWIELTKSETSLTIKVNENTLTDTRKAEVTVIAGGAIETLSVEQVGSDVVIVTTPEELEVEQWGGVFKFNVKTNINNWDVNCDVDWIKMTAIQVKNEVIIDVDENTAREGRVAKLTFSVDGNKNSIDVSITQNGALYYILPYLDLMASENDIKTFEEARRSFFNFNSDYTNRGLMTFNTKSEVFPIVKYKFNQNYLWKVFLYASTSEFIEDPAFEQMMKDAGFEPDKDGAYILEVSREKNGYKIKAEVIIPDEIVFTFIEAQPYAMPTFEILPFGFLDFSTTGTVDEIKKWESENGGKLFFSFDYTGIYRFSVTPNLDKATPIERYYWRLKSGSLEGCKHTFINTEHVFYEVRGQYYLTQEFIDLLKQTGFVDLLGYDGYHRYLYGGPNIDCRLMIDTKFEDHAHLLEVTFRAITEDKKSAGIKTQNNSF